MKYDSQTKAAFLAAKLEGLAFLFRALNPNQGGRRDQEAMDGISLILEGLAKDADEVAQELDINHRKDSKKENA